MNLFDQHLTLGVFNNVTIIQRHNFQIIIIYCQKYLILNKLKKN